jgi:hypothetical protein
VLGRPGPGHELIDARSGPEIDEPGEHVGDVGLRINAVQFAGFDERRDASPVLRSLIVAGEERVFAVEHDRADAPFDDVGVELDAAVIDEAREPVPMVQAIADGLGDRRLGRDLNELVFQPSPERNHERVTAFLADGTAHVGAVASKTLRAAAMRLARRPALPQLAMIVVDE